MQQQPYRCPGFDKSGETKLRLDVYIRPWPAAWSFLRLYIRAVAVKGLKKFMCERDNFDNCLQIIIKLKVSQMCHQSYPLALGFDAKSYTKSAVSESSISLRD